VLAAFRAASTYGKDEVTTEVLLHLGRLLRSKGTPLLGPIEWEHVLDIMDLLRPALLPLDTEGVPEAQSILSGLYQTALTIIHELASQSSFEGQLDRCAPRSGARDACSLTGGLLTRVCGERPLLSRGRVLELLWRLQDRLPEPLALFLLRHRAAAIVPGAPDWATQAAALVTDFVLHDARPDVRREALTAVSRLYATARFLYGPVLLERVIVPLVGDAAAGPSSAPVPPVLLDPDDGVALLALGLVIEAVCDFYATVPAAVDLLRARLADVTLGRDAERAAVATRGLLDLFHRALFRGPAETCSALFLQLLQLAAPLPETLPSAAAAAAAAADEAERARAEADEKRLREVRAAVQLEVLRVLLRVRAQPSGRLYLVADPANRSRSGSSVTVGAGGATGQTPVERLGSTYVCAGPAADSSSGALPLPVPAYVRYGRCARTCSRAAAGGRLTVGSAPSRTAADPAGSSRSCCRRPSSPTRSC